ncbi:hypothetical protein [Streptomyces sp. NBC_01506]|uniref:hypothetical protein n=1 Tax=Streptomyces sp. NBC_01506 TaxID=2903887 RepID=UPI00386A4615
MTLREGRGGAAPLSSRDLRLRHVEAMYDAIERENAERLLHHAKVVELQRHQRHVARLHLPWPSARRDVRSALD